MRNRRDVISASLMPQGLGKTFITRYRFMRRRFRSITGHDKAEREARITGC